MKKLALSVILYSAAVFAQDKEITRGDEFLLEWRNPYDTAEEIEKVLWYSVVWSCDTDIDGESDRLDKSVHSYNVDTQTIYGECVFKVMWEYLCTPTENQGNIYESEEYIILIKLPKPARGGFR